VVMFGYFVALLVAQEGVCENAYTACVWHRIPKRIYFEHGLLEATTCKTTEVTVLNASRCSLEEVPVSLLDFTSATIVDLRGNELQTMGLAVPLLLERSCKLHFEPVLSEITRLDWAGGGLTALWTEQVLAKTPNLRAIVADNNSLTSLPGEFLNEYCPMIDLISVSHNQLSKVPNDVFELPKLRELDLSYNRITLLSRDLAVWGVVSHNATEAAGRVIKFGNNPVTRLSFWNGLDFSDGLHSDLATLKLKKLSLPGSGVSYLPNWLGELTELEEMQVWRRDATKLHASSLVIDTQQEQCTR